MDRILYLLLDAGIASLLFLPFFYWLNKRHLQSKRHTVWYFLFAVYLAGVYAVAGLPDIRYVRLNLHFNMIPFAYMFSDYKNSLLNVLLFVPLGFFLPVFCRRYQNPCWAVLLGLLFSLVIEVMQIFTFRATDINDLMTNSTGTLLGWCFGWLFTSLIPGYPLEVRSRHLRLVFIISFGGMFFLHPFIADMVFTLLGL